MIIFWPKNETSPLLSLNRSWLTDPTSLRRSQALGLPFGLVCTLGHLHKLLRQQLDRFTHLMSKSRVRIIDHENGPAQVIDHIDLKLESLQKMRPKQGSKLPSHLNRVLNPDSGRDHVKRQER